MKDSSLWHDGMEFIPDYNVCDHERVKRTWAERLFEFPWKPWQSHKSVFAPKAYMMPGNKVILSLQSYAALRTHIQEKKKNGSKQA
jgi:hypothetical protein